MLGREAPQLKHHRNASSNSVLRLSCKECGVQLTHFKDFGSQDNTGKVTISDYLVVVGVVMLDDFGFPACGSEHRHYSHVGL